MSLFNRILRGTTTIEESVKESAKKSYVIEFTLWEDDPALEIQLEPDCYNFKVEPDNTLKFVALADSSFKWAMRIDIKSGGVQLFPEGNPDYEITIYENDILLEDWYKFMR